MPTLINRENPTIFDVMALLGPDGVVKESAIVDLLAETNEVLEDAVMMEANNGDSNKEVVCTSLPSVAQRYYNEPIKPEPGSFSAITDFCAMFYKPVIIDKALWELNNMKNAFLLAQSRPQIEAINQAMARSIFYGGMSDGHDRMLGLSERYSTLTRRDANGILPETSDYIIDAGGTGSDLTSIWFTNWSYNGGDYMFFPKGSKAGLQQGSVDIEDTMAYGGGYMPAVKTSFEWKAGLCVKDVRQNVRICNIDLKTITADDLLSMMIDGSERIHNPNEGRTVIYMNRPMRTRLRQLLVTSQKLSLMFYYDNARPRLEGVEGRKIMFFDEFPIRRVDAISMHEAQVV